MASMQGKGILGVERLKSFPRVPAFLGHCPAVLPRADPISPLLRHLCPGLEIPTKSWEWVCQGTAQHLPALHESRLQPSADELCRGSPECGTEHPPHVSTAQPAQPSKALLQPREEGKQLLPSHKTRLLLAWKVKWLCRRMHTRESCPRWPDVNGRQRSTSQAGAAHPRR